MTDLTYAYAAPSALIAAPGGAALRLATFAEAPAGGVAPSAFFRGGLRDAWLTARGLATLARVVAARFVPQAAVLRDPIVTAGAGGLRFEAFSSCNGVYARLDLDPAALTGEVLAAGTTNVDFNEPMLNALARIGRAETVALHVGAEAVTLERAAGTVTERKVALPTRWLKGLTAAQGYLALMEERLRLPRAQATQLLAALPAGVARADLFLTVRGGRPAFAAVAVPGAVRVGSAHRLRLLDGLLPLAQEVRAWATPDGQASAVTLHLGGGHRLLLALSADVNRGFSGEGNLLDALFAADSPDLPADWLAANLSGANALFRANEVFNPTLLAVAHDLPPAALDHLGARLAALGLLGFDLDANAFFYRRLPFRPERLAALNPRLAGAQALLDGAADDVQLAEIGPDGRRVVRVRGTGVWHTVVLGAADADVPARCTCPWFTRQQGQRGPCKHVLAARARFGS